MYPNELKLAYVSNVFKKYDDVKAAVQLFALSLKAYVVSIAQNV